MLHPNHNPSLTPCKGLDFLSVALLTSYVAVSVTILRNHLRGGGSGPWLSWIHRGGPELGKSRLSKMCTLHQPFIAHAAKKLRSRKLTYYLLQQENKTNNWRLSSNMESTPKIKMVGDHPWVVQESIRDFSFIIWFWSKKTLIFTLIQAYEPNWENRWYLNS